MRTTRKVLETKVNSYNSISDIKLKLNDDVVGAINLYTEDNNRIATATLKEMYTVLDALINVKALENANRQQQCKGGNCNGYRPTNRKEVLNITYFKNVETLEELRRQYKELLKKYHPDNPQGSTEATQSINAEYDKLFKVLKNKHESKTTDSDKEKADFNLNYS